ncbi:Glyoxalase domain-containing protein 4,Glyoxalase 1 [Mytilus edulis]|uniref:Glyoxalase domain-containing protein 4,Glyoxalase 1 n=1 Tax=Mytilus edulis TaxID=6550 RepID=A0A8S3PXR6_MYTED|nr:Glyoxalase domain-containing protein 4,Glyoxalase 1 [Mytilus edulis]
MTTVKIKAKPTTFRRALHFVFKLKQGPKTAGEFYRDILGMKFLRHEEFEKGCEAACNGPYDGKWSKSMVGYGPEDSHFVVELTYNYGIGAYKLGNDFRGITIHSKDIIRNANKLNYPVVTDGESQILTSLLMAINLLSWRKKQRETQLKRLPCLLQT